MKKIKTLSAAALLLLAVACSKSNNDVQPPSASVDKKLTKIVYTDSDGSTSTEAMTYDAQNRLATYTDDDHVYSFSYETAASLKITRKKIADGSTDQLIEGVINEAGAATQLKYISMPGNTVSYIYNIIYDANGRIIKLNGMNGLGGNTMETVYEYVNSNTIKSKVYHGGVLYDTREYSYDLSKVNKGPFALWETWPSDKLFGKTTPYLLKEYKNTNQSGQVSWHTQSVHQLDNNGYPVQSTYSYLHSNTSTVATFTFK